MWLGTVLSKLFVTLNVLEKLWRPMNVGKQIICSVKCSMQDHALLLPWVWNFITCYCENTPNTVDSYNLNWIIGILSFNCKWERNCHGTVTKFQLCFSSSTASHTLLKTNIIILISLVHLVVCKIFLPGVPHTTLAYISVSWVCGHSHFV